MPPRRFPNPSRRLALAALLALGACGPDSRSEPRPEGAAVDSASTPDPRPNLILVSIDTLRADRLGVYGHDRDTSPNLDALAARGLLFEQAYSTAPWTLLSHLSMLTGLYVDQHGVRQGGRALSGEIETLAERLDAAGYETAGFYFDGWIHPRHGFARGFDVFEPHADVLEAERHLATFLNGRDRSRPLFLFLHLFDVHTVQLTPETDLLYQPPDAFARRYRPDAPDLFAPGDAAAMWELEMRPTEEQYEAIQALYDGGIRYVDERLGAILDAWRARGLLDNALLVVTSDHGESLGLRDGRLPGHGGLYQEGLRVPLIVTLPDGSRAGERVEPAVSTIDIAPTLLAAAGAPVDDLPGYDLRTNARPPEDLIRARHGNQLALIRWPVKSVAISNGFAPLVGRAGWSVRLDEDPAGSELLRYPDGPAAFNALRRELNAAIEAELTSEDSIAFRPVPAEGMDAAAAERLRALGYAEETDAARSGD